ncbi:signal recognition particle protein [bacterium 210820-DFI.6.52]|uniref:Signal recognition particle protein n=1 Tax=Bittarella massiliensis (ex Durand et al. 2017) TaxID=1720313 RepID=A0AAQ1RX19_9FIRM|nr:MULTISPECIES: signal recognition particle protein [Eubacteriales]MCB5941243.1 signal recognition particle protein [bacterium 210820-DFI.6.52]ERI99824.1 signal recognition particle protein [Clostridium sp. ATCC 29733]MZL69265.1 signal recognition particle protein [Bittarella massiliensis (ex Durand et al. 2017)]MZL79193.1 signal recognition particle protein [Bittarella massiliensis (ex Durand et al. 2017)]SHG56103.1 signal recognition particle subunit FFH/SRP54 (srp54) [Bittarella massiliens
MAFEGLSEKLSAAFKKLKQKGKLGEKDVKTAMREVRLALLEADVNYKVAKQFVDAVTERAVGAAVFESLTPAQQVIKIVHEELISLMGGEVSRLHIPSKPPCVIMMCGLQGSGKTTHSGKLGKLLKSQGHRPLLVACDVYRPAAIKQLQVVGEQAGVPVFEMGQGDPVEIAKKALGHAKDHGNDIVILDTAGRLHIDEALMAELAAIKAAVGPDEILLVIDSMTGQDAVSVAESFNQLLEITGVVLTKLDGDTRGGAALSVKAVTGKPIKFSGTGEKLDDLEPFYPDRMASRILGMGDVLTFIEKAQTQFDEKQQKAMEEKFRKNKFDLEDMLVQLDQMRNMGSLQQIVSMLPGGIGNKLSGADLDDRQMDQVRAIICSMTPEERAKPKLINPSRKRRIAAGSGTRVEDVNRLLKQFETMSKLMKQFSRPGKRRRMMPFM